MAVFQVDPEASLGLFAKAAKLGHAKAMIRLGHCHQTGTGTYRSRKQALMWYKKSVEAGNLSAQYQIGFMYETGEKNIPPDYGQAIEWYEKALHQQSLKACAGLARIYASGNDPAFHDGEKATKYAAILVRKDPQDAEGYDLLAAAYARNLEFDNAVKAVSQAAAVSSLDAVESLRQRKDEYKTGCPFPAIATDAWILQAAEQGSMWAMLKLARRHGDILDEMYDLAKSRHWYEQAVEDGSKEAQVRLGMLYRRGAGGPKDLPKAFWCFSDAAEAEVEAAYAPLARMYVGGKGVRCNTELAREWYGKAMQSGNKSISSEFSALRTLGSRVDEQSGHELYLKGKGFAESGIQPDGKVASLPSRTSRVFALYWVAAEKGHVAAMQAIAEMYFYGPTYFERDSEPNQKSGGIRTNYRKAMGWYEQLRQNGITPPEYGLCQEFYLEELRNRRTREKGR